MEKQIFKVGDKVFDIRFGWGIVKKTLDTSCYNYPIIVFFDNIGNIITYASDGSFGAGMPKMLSFTEYTLQGFSQERPVNYKEYVGKWGKFWDVTKHSGIQNMVIGHLSVYNENDVDGFPFACEETGVYYTNFESLTEEQIKVLNLK